MSIDIISESKRRCIEQGMKPDQIPVPVTTLSPLELKRSQNKYHTIISVVDFFGQKLVKMLDGPPIMILIADHEGYVLSLFGDENIRQMMNKLGIVEGMQFSEKEMGTNVVHMALLHNRSIQLVGPQHFHEVLWQTACYCVPFHFKKINNLSGTIAIMTATQYHSPFILPLLTSMVDSMERELLLRQASRDQTIINDLMINTMNNGVIITDDKGNIQEFNSFAEKITNRDRESVIGNPIFAFEQFGNYIYNVLKNKQRFQDIELTFTNSLDHRTICLFDAMPIFGDRGNLIGSYAQFRDITERYDLEKQIITSEKFSAIGKLAAGLAHEIRNPLTSVMGFIYLLRERAKTESESGYLDLIYSELETMKQLVSDFVMMAKPGSPDRKDVVIEDLLRDTVRFMESQAKLTSSTITDYILTDETSMRIDPIQIKQVLINLIQNALEAMPDGGEVKIESRLVNPNSYQITISDEGIGMTDDEMREVMNPFFTTKEAGLGLGLSTCYRIIENHKGKLSFTSQKGRGTKFTIILPR
ncbi:ATP-binding protein [Paenibacillus mucilaginosus]|uniref:histidine kinase n=1 Tax=Paenibacillus mucilaginosus (strain KNP414) TaxID=1036673 RepID=F8F840_PAEMK|nr:ATP-binding protein [Paenibacillus mucilaginosus]AEI41025.1 two-component sensor histidine kinase [Paenibacillus mucilaginosus KNP414]WDM30095.1 PAS domain-containing protein [Paenibacillus mucilaginosus]